MSRDDREGDDATPDRRGPTPTRTKVGDREDRRSEADRPIWRSPRLVIAARELRALKSEKTIVLALVIQLFVAAFSSFLVVGLVSLYDPSAVEGFTVDVAVTGDATDQLVDVMDREPGVRAREYDTPEAARQAFQRNGAIDGVMVADESPNGTIRVTAVAPSESIRTTLIVVKMRDTMEALERSLRDEYSAEGRIQTEPLVVPDETQSSPYFAFTYTVLIPLLMFLPAFISGSIAVDSLTEEVQRGTMELLRAAPVTLPDIVDAKMLSTASLAPAQAALWLALLWYQGTAIARPLALIAVVGGLSMSVVAIGVGISFLTPDRRQAQFLYSSGILALAAVATLLPEHPANTIAKLAIGSATVETWAAVAAYAALGVVAYLGVRIGVEFVDEEGI